MLAAVFAPLCVWARARQPYSARQGDLMITVTKVQSFETRPRIPSGLPLRAIDGYHFVEVSLEVRNVGRQAECADFAPVMLRATFGIQVDRMIVGGAEAPEINQLLPDKTTQGTYRFEVRDGVTPLEIILTPSGSEQCGGGGPFSGGSYLRPVKIHLPPESLAPTQGKEQYNEPKT